VGYSTKLHYDGLLWIGEICLLKLRSVISVCHGHNVGCAGTRQFLLKFIKMKFCCIHCVVGNPTKSIFIMSVWHIQNHMIAIQKVARISPMG
jgi:hypothetical protein